MATNWDATLPSGSISFAQGDNDIRANQAALEDALDREHNFPGNEGSDAGLHTFGVGDTTARAAAITSPATGNFWFNTDFGTNGLLQIYDGSDWITLGSGGETGMVGFFASDTAPAGGADPPVAGNLWVPAWDGDEVLVTDFPDLATFFGATGGGGGSSVWDNFRSQANPAALKFRLPKMSKLYVAMYDPLDTEYDAVGDEIGADTVALVEDDLPELVHASHTHTLTALAVGGGSGNQENPAGNSWSTGVTTAGTVVDPHGNAAGADAHENRPETVVLRPWVHV